MQIGGPVIICQSKNEPVLSVFTDFYIFQTEYFEAAVRALDRAGVPVLLICCVVEI